MNNKRLVFCTLLMVTCSLLYAVDFGLTLDQSGAFSTNGSESNQDYSSIFVPRILTYWGESGELLISAGMKVEYQNETWSFVPELLRMEVSQGFGRWFARAGRMHYADPLGYIAQGLFDGGRVSFDTETAGTFGAGAWYTGFLYKNRADITMTAEEHEALALPVDFNDFNNSYFAPRRLIAAVDWEHPSFLDFCMVDFALLVQFDVSGENLNSQYLVGNIALPFRNVLLDLGGCLGLIQNSEDSGVAFAADVGISWTLPGILPSRLSFLSRYTSGVSDSLKAFVPITNKPHGFTLKPGNSGLSLFSLDYALRLNPDSSLNLSSTYFIRNDLVTYSSMGDEGHFLGNELFAQFFWSPLSDMHVNLGAGIFLPSLGNAAPDAKSLWRIELNFIVSIF